MCKAREDNAGVVMPAKAGISIREYVRGFRLGGRNDKSGKSQLIEPFDSVQGDAWREVTGSFATLRMTQGDKVTPEQVRGDITKKRNPTVTRGIPLSFSQKLN